MFNQFVLIILQVLTLYSLAHLKLHSHLQPPKIVGPPPSQKQTKQPLLIFSLLPQPDSLSSLPAAAAHSTLQSFPSTTAAAEQHPPRTQIGPPLLPPLLLQPLTADAQPRPSPQTDLHLSFNSPSNASRGLLSNDSLYRSKPPPSSFFTDQQQSSFLQWRPQKQPHSQPRTDRRICNRQRRNEPKGRRKTEVKQRK